ncbi:MAG: cysteine desulfurase [Lachnospiraceae bacterium]|nr:cysteine desulfurase [Lachnospiraceae bacterium]
MKEIYLDNSATTKCFDNVAEAVSRCLTEEYGNPSSAHHLGVVAEKKIREAREIFAKILRVKESEIYFTSGGTESDNLAILGAARANKRNGMHVITTKIEHPAVLNTMAELEKEGFEVTYLPVDEAGVISAEEGVFAVSGDTVLISVMHTNNEIGSLQPVAQLGRLLKRKYPKLVFHVDAVQGFGKAAIYPKEMGIDLMSISSHKIHGPKGAGVLYISEKTKIAPLVYGGGQQKDIRPGTENVPGIVGMAEAAKTLFADMEADTETLYAIKKDFVRELSGLEDVEINGLPGVRNVKGLSDDAVEKAVRASAPHIISASFKGVRSEVLLHALEERNIYVSAGSACSTHKKTDSATLTAIGLKAALMDSTIRFSTSVFTKKEDTEETVRALRELLPELRKYSAR